MQPSAWSLVAVLASVPTATVTLILWLYSRRSREAEADDHDASANKSTTEAIAEVASVRLEEINRLGSENKDLRKEIADGKQMLVDQQARYKTELDLLEQQVAGWIGRYSRLTDELEDLKRQLARVRSGLDAGGSRA